MPQPPPLPTNPLGGGAVELTGVAGVAGKGGDEGLPEVAETGTGGSPPKALPVLPLCPAPPPKPSEQREVIPPMIGEDADDQPRRRWWLPTRAEVASFLVSSVFHTAVFLALGAIVVATGGGKSISNLVASFTEPLSPEVAAGDPEVLMVVPESNRPASDAGEVAHVSVPQEQPEIPQVVLPQEKPRQAADSQALARATQPAARPADLLEAVDAPAGGGLEGRAERLRARLSGKGDGLGVRRGATGLSEEAVERALRWLVAHQRDDGSWNFDHTKGLCQGLCRNPGTFASTTASTAIALLPFLGAGYTHQEGEHREVVKRGFYYLSTRVRITADGIDLQEGSMYSQGLAAIAFCEVYAMTGDPAMKDLAQGAIDFIVHAQDKKGGGWRYRPGEPGDTTVTGWELMALKSAEMAKLKVPRSVIYLAEHFLDTVQRESGAQYGYQATGRNKGTHTTTAIGLLCRMYTGWTRSRPALQRGVGYLSKWGPSEDDMYYNYYATQVLFHWGGRAWEPWNRRMRDFLVSTQATAGHEAGSWHFGHSRNDVGGRLFNTAMGAMILEVYYRHMPLYDHKAFQVEP